MTDPFISYGQNWEDVRLRRIFANQRDGFYIDIGAALPVNHSFTKYLYDKGWTGINVEPLPQFFSVLAKQRDRDLNINAAVSTQHGQVTLFVDELAPGSSKIVSADFEDDSTVLVDTVSLSAICEQYAKSTIDVMKIDVEGAEEEVIRSGDWAKFRPRLLVVEANQPDSWEPILLKHGYLRVAHDGINIWFVEPNDRKWRPILEPPVSALDRFVPYELIDPNTGLSGLVERQQARIGKLERQVRSVAESAANGAPRTRGPITGASPRLLFVLSSENQLYSGTGRMIFESLRRMRDDFDITLSIDDLGARNLRLCREFADQHRLPLVVHRGRRVGWAPDVECVGLAQTLERGWDIVEAVSWANAATNLTVLQHSGDAAVVYTPLLQPVTTVPMNRTMQTWVEAVHRRMIDRADLVISSTNHEQSLIDPDRLSGTGRTRVISLGCDFNCFLPGPLLRTPTLLCVADYREKRKRIDRVFSVVARLREMGTDLPLTLVGEGSSAAAAGAPAGILDLVSTTGFVTEQQLVAIYQSAGAFILLSEYEAFGIPIAEALATCTPVIASDLDTIRSAFGELPGVNLVDPDDVDSVASTVNDVLRSGQEMGRALQDRREFLRDRFDWDCIVLRKSRHLTATAARRIQSAS